MIRFPAWIEAFDQSEMTLTLTLLLLVIHPVDYWYVKTPVTVLALIGLVYRPARQSSALWFLLTAFLAGGCFRNWLTVDNHKFLTAYWTLAIALGQSRFSTAGTLATNARLMTGLSFAFAVAAKLASADYRDASFFNLTLLTDSRFRYVTEWLGGIPADQLAVNRAHLTLLTDGFGIEAGARLVTSLQTATMARFLTVWTVGIESALAAAFLAPAWSWIARRRDVLLLLFAFTTYAVASVVGFGWVLLIMGYAQCRTSHKGLQACYLAALLMMEVYTMPWGQVVSPLFGAP